MGIFARLREAVRGVGPETSTAPKHLGDGALSAADSPDMHADEALDPEPVLDGLRLELGYVDAEGRRTNRLVTCKRLVHSDDGDRLLAFCHARRTDRTFLLDRIIDAANHATGARIGDIRAFFAPFREQAGDLDDDHGTTRKVLEELGDELRILAFIAKADETLHTAEDNLISVFVRSRSESLGHEVAGNYDHAKVMDWFRHQAPDIEAIERSVLRVAKRSEAQLGHIWELAAKVMEADGTVMPEELDRLHALAHAVDLALSELRKDIP
ncbi:MAG: WYL domain-containing protein [Pseudomonadota bacterium]